MVDILSEIDKVSSQIWSEQHRHIPYRFQKTLLIRARVDVSKLLDHAITATCLPCTEWTDLARFLPIPVFLQNANAEQSRNGKCWMHFSSFAHSVHQKPGSFWLILLLLSVRDQSKYRISFK